MFTVASKKIKKVKLMTYLKSARGSIELVLIAVVAVVLVAVGGYVLYSRSHSSASTAQSDVMPLDNGDNAGADNTQSLGTDATITDNGTDQ
jgi:uncharacterized protein (UPF0333 family)